MKRLTKEFQLSCALWVLSVVAYTGSLELPWFILDQGTPIQTTKKSVSNSQVVITGLDGFEFLLDRLRGGSFVWLAHPMLWVGWLFLVCRRWRAATIAGCLALVLALNVPLLFQPREGPWIPPSIGYYLWFASMVILASSTFFFRRDPVVENELFRRLVTQQRTFAAELADLKQQVADLVDHQAATFLEEFEARETR